jgi:glyoxylate/hydroxypyruvate reductase
MRRLAVIHHHHQAWAEALREAEPRLDIRSWHPREAESADPDWLAGAEGLFTWRFPKGFLARMPRLIWIQNSGAGVDHLVGNPEIPPGIPITRADGLFGFWMARYAVGHLLLDAQRIEACREAQTAGTWSPSLLPEDLTGQVGVVVGFGRIGLQIGRALRELGLEVHGIASRARLEDGFHVHVPDALPGLLGRARVLVLCAPLTAATYHLVDGRLLAAGHGRLLLVNVGRGDLVDHDALLAALDAGRLGRAVLDVFPVEPLPTDSPLWRHPKVSVTPHHSGPSTPRALIPDILDNLRRFAEGRPIHGAVDRARGY